MICIIYILCEIRIFLVGIIKCCDSTYCLLLLEHMLLRCKMNKKTMSLHLQFLVHVPLSLQICQYKSCPTYLLHNTQFVHNTSIIIGWKKLSVSGKIQAIMSLWTCGLLSPHKQIWPNHCINQTTLVLQVWVHHIQASEVLLMDQS